MSLNMRSMKALILRILSKGETTGEDLEAQVFAEYPDEHPPLVGACGDQSLAYLFGTGRITLRTTDGTAHFALAFPLLPGEGLPPGSPGATLQALEPSAPGDLESYVQRWAIRPSDAPPLSPAMLSNILGRMGEPFPRVYAEIVGVVQVGEELTHAELVERLQGKIDDLTEAHVWIATLGVLGVLAASGHVEVINHEGPVDAFVYRMRLP